jgi:hypothetical protein
MHSADAIKGCPGARGAAANLTALSIIALSIYGLWGAFLIAQKPGLEDDEALMVAGAVHMRHPEADFPLARPAHAWICPLGHCVPLMSADYVGAVREYLTLPLFSLFGTGAASVRVVSLFLGGVGIWGIGMLFAELLGTRTGAAVAVTLAMSPAYLMMVVFDNAAVAPMMAGLGLTCAALAGYARRRSIAWAFIFGAAIGFSVWARANSLWTIAAGGLAALLVYRRAVLVPLRHALAICAGGILGGWPFLLFQFVSGGTTWKDQSFFATHESWRELLRYRLFLFSDVLLADGEHRRMWNAVMSLPQWQLWLFPILVVAGCIVCLFAGRGEQRERSLTRAADLTFLFLAAELFFSRMALAEHHFIALVPPAVAVVVLAGRTLAARGKYLRLLTAGFAVLYGATAIAANVSAIRGLRTTGGLGDWSDGAAALAKDLVTDSSAGTLKIVDWGFEDNLYVLTDARLNAHELFWNSSEQQDDRKKPWADEIREGGRFLLSGPENRHFMAVVSGFEKALAEAGAVTHRYRVLHHDGSTYAQVIDIEPHSGREAPPGDPRLQHEILLGDSHFDAQLSGFYPFSTRWKLFYQIDQDGWREMQRSFAVDMGVPEQGRNGFGLFVHLFIPEDAISKQGALTLAARCGEHSLPPESYDRSGMYTYRRAIPADWIPRNSIHVEFTVGDPHPATASPKSGVLVRAISLEPQ